MKSYYVLFFILLSAGCTQMNYLNEENTPAVSVNDYFVSNLTSYHYMVVNQTIQCINGSCPSPEVSVSGVTLQCTFCNSNNTGIVGDEFRVRFGVSGWGDLAGNCALNVVTHEVIGNFDILSMNSTELIVQVIRTGHVKQSGIACEAVYEYDYENIENWYFIKP